MTAGIRAIVVEDSPFLCHLLTTQLQAAPDIRVVGSAVVGRGVVEMVQELQPDIVLLDLELPDVSTPELIKQLMTACPTPILGMTGNGSQSAQTALEALEHGAVDFLLEYRPGVDTPSEGWQQQLQQAVRRVARVRPRPPRSRLPAASALGPADLSSGSDPLLALPLHGIVVIGAAQGGPPALRELLHGLPADFPLPIVIVQQLPSRFLPVLAQRLQAQTPLAIREARLDDALKPGQVLLAPGDWHLVIRSEEQIHLERSPKIAGQRPAIDVTMQSAARVFGPQAIGLLLTGLGSDGVLGLTAIRSQGGRTAVQELASCLVPELPEHALQRGAVDQIGTPEELARWLRTGCGRSCPVLT